MDPLIRISRRARVALMALMLTSLACADDLVEVPEAEPGMPYCMVVVGTRGHYDDGGVHLVFDKVKDQNPAGCACTPHHKEWTDETRAMLNELALEDCERVAAQYEFAWDECREDYEAGEWLQVFMHVGEGSDSPQYKPAELRCEDG